MKPRDPSSASSLPLTDELIERCLAGRCSGAEAERVYAYFAAHPGVARYYRSLRAALGGEAVQARQDAESAYAALMQRIREDLSVPAPATVPDILNVRSAERRWRGRISITRITRYAGVATFVALAVTLLTWHRGVTAAPTIYVTPREQRADIMLPDGSTVMLNVASRLEVPADFTAGDRTIHLTGEALFSVMHHTGAPFTVITGNATVRVLGTSYVVRHYASDTTSTVAVQTGKVAVATAVSHGIVLMAQQQAELSQTGVVRVRAADPGVFTFASGVLTLNGVPLRDAIVEFDRWYDADIRLGDPALGDKLVQGAFAAGSLGDLAQVLGFTFHARVVHVGRVITLYSR